MKKLATILCLSSLATGAFAQGTITPANVGNALFRTNATAIGQGSGSTAPTLGGFVYGIFTAPSTVTSISPNLQELLTSTWTFTGVYATNAAITTGGRESGGTAVTANGSWGVGITNSYLLVGWSANLAGQNWSSIAAMLNGAHFGGGAWTGSNFISTAANAYLGATAIGYGAAGGTDSGGNAVPAFPLFNTGTPTTGGVPLSTPTDLYIITVPEPSTFALAGLGAAALLIFRRRK